MIVIDLRKQQAPYTDPKAIQKINFTGIRSDNNNRFMFSLSKKQKKLF